MSDPEFVDRGQIGLELPMDSIDAAEEKNKPNGRTLLFVLGPGFVEHIFHQHHQQPHPSLCLELC